MNLKITISIISILILFNSCDYRTPSKDRFENITKIELPDSITVIQDIFEEAGPDYGLFYKITLLDTDCLDFKSKIEHSKDWVKKDNEWTFYKTVNGTIYNITFSVEKCQISYNEDLI